MTRETKKKTSAKNKTALKPSDEKVSAAAALKRKINAVNEEFTDAFIKEVDEDVKNDNLKAFWDKYGLYVIVFVVAALTLAVSFESIKAWKVKRDEAMSNTYISALDMQARGKLDGSLKMLQKISEDGNGIYRDIAKLQAVNILLEQGETDKALSELETIVNNEKINPSLRAASRLKFVSLKFDNMKSDEISAVLAPISNDAQWAPYAKEFMAMAAIRDGNLEQAKTLYNEIFAMPDLSDELRARVQDILSVLNEQ